MIEISGLVKRYGRRSAVDGLTLQVPAGSCFALLGPNGAGKTTTVKVLSGLVKPDAGEVRVGGHPAGCEAARGLLGYVPDQPYLYERLSGREFLVFVGRMYGMDAVESSRGIAEMSERFELGAFLDELAEGYSHGMRQRVVFAAALLHRPKVLVVDEPLVGLDPRSIRLVKDLLKERRREGVAILISTHVLDTQAGRPAPGIPVGLHAVGDDGSSSHLGDGTTDTDGRVGSLTDGPVQPGIYRLVFDTADYFVGAHGTSFYPRITVEVHLDGARSHYHVPVLASLYSFCTYLGS